MEPSMILYDFIMAMVAGVVGGLVAFVGAVASGLK